MTDHMFWFLAAALMVATVLTVGTLAAAGMMPWQRPAPVTPTAPSSPQDAEREREAA